MVFKNIDTTFDDKQAKNDVTADLNMMRDFLDENWEPKIDARFNAGKSAEETMRIIKEELQVIWPNMKSHKIFLKLRWKQN